MIPLKLTLKNFIGIRSGLGRDELVLDLDKITDGAQLIALVGPNGAGKSTILDNLHPYRLMPSRAGGYSPASFSFYENVYGTEASKVLEWEHAGHRYRSELIFKMGAKAKKAEAYLFENDAPVVLPDNTRSDGKAETYDRCIEHILGTPEMFFSAVFASQNRRPLSAYTTGEIKGLLSELLGLEHIRELGSKSNDVTKLLKMRLDNMREDLSKLDTLEAERAGAETTLETDKGGLSLKEQERKAARQAVTDATKRLSDVKADMVEVEAHRTSLQARFNSIQQRVGAALRQLDADILDEKRRTSGMVAAARTELENIHKQVAAHQKQIADNEALLSRKAEIEAAQSALPILEQELAAAEAAVTVARSKDMEYRALVTERMSLKNTLASVGNEGKTLTTTCDGLKVRAGLIDQVPCQGTDLQPRCPLLKEANTARAQIPIAEANAEAKRQEYANIQTRGHEIEAHMALMANPSATLREAEEKQQQVAERIKATTATAALASGLAQVQQSLDNASSLLQTLNQTATDKAAEIERIETESATRLTDLTGRRAITGREGDGERKAVQMELEALPPPADESVTVKAELAVEEAERAQAEIDTQTDTLNAKIAAGKERVRSLTEQIKAAGSVRAKASLIEAEIAHWTTLSKALGNDGIIALSIDDAGPTLASLANDLLVSCYGPRFSVRISTQEETQKGTMKENFDIIVFDGERDDEKSVSAMSGGERIYINDVLTRAIALYQAQLSGRQYGCLFSDESDGALDPEKKLQFTAMKKRVLEIGGYRQEFFISHTPEVQEMADAKIDLGALKQLN